MCVDCMYLIALGADVECAHLPEFTVAAMATFSAFLSFAALTVGVFAGFGRYISPH